MNPETEPTREPQSEPAPAGTHCPDAAPAPAAPDLAALVSGGALASLPPGEISVSSEGPAAPPPEPKMVEIRPGKKVNLEHLLNHWNPRCLDCHQGWQTILVEGVRVARICSCCVLRFERAEREYNRVTQRITKAVTSTLVAPTPRPEDLERAQRRIDRLAAVVAPLEQELKEREADFKGSLQPLYEAIGANGSRSAEMEDELARLGKKVDQDEVLLAQALETVALLREEIANHQAQLRRSQETKDLAEAGLSDLKAELARRKEDFQRRTRRLRHDIAKAQGRLARARGYSGLDTGDDTPPAPPADAPPTAEEGA